MIEKFQQRFVDEAGEYCDQMEQYLLELERNPENRQSVDEVFRLMHSLKGSGAMFGFSLLSEFTHELESLFQLIREGQLSLNPEIISLTLDCVTVFRKILKPDCSADDRELVRRLVAEIRKMMVLSAEKKAPIPASGTSAGDSVHRPETKTYFVYFCPGPDVFQNGTNPLYLMDELNALGDCRTEADMSRVPLPDQLEVDKCYTSWRVVLTTPEQKESIADVFLFVKDRSRIEIEEVKGMSLPGDKGIPDWFFREKPEEILRRLRDKAGTGEKQAVRAGFRTEDSLQLSLSTIRVDSHDVDVYVNLVSELITAQSRLFALAGTRTDPELEALAEHFDKLIHQLRDNAFEMGMIPLISMGTHFKRLVRDLSAELKKKVRLVLTGLDTEVDKQVIEKLATPMIHLIRNSIDHGIESPEQRVRAGKSEEGTVTVSAGYDGNQVEIRVRDDGAGLDLAKIRETAVRLGITGGQEQSQEAGWYDFIFRPGFSTSEQVNDVSGRGVGLDAARKVIRDLNGDLSVETKAGGGSCFVIRVPLSMSVIDGLKVRVNEQLYLIPSSHVQQIFPFKNNPDEDRIRQVHLAEGKQIPYLDLSMLFYGLSSSLRRYLLAVKYRDGLFGLVVDDVLGERQTVVKPVDAMQHDRSIFLGASILGNGQVALILDVKKIIQKMAG